MKIQINIKSVPGKCDERKIDIGDIPYLDNMLRFKMHITQSLNSYALIILIKCIYIALV